MHKQGPLLGGAQLHRPGLCTAEGDLVQPGPCTHQACSEVACVLLGYRQLLACAIHLWKGTALSSLILSFLSLNSQLLACAIHLWKGTALSSLKEEED